MSEPVVTASALLVNESGQVLFGLRADWKKAWPGHWDAIGGRVEPDETPEDAMRREVREETGVTPTEFLWLDCVPERRPDVYGDALHHVYAVTAWTGGVPENVCDEHTEIRWFAPEELDALMNLADIDYARLVGVATRQRQAVVSGG
ncbi:8-oxo-dGTP pyrophosphatase MutT (NUDIX family) [Aminobacter lissarensis]|uniref:8-oxo-dGTP pyrophosphatase MutT (NUDIX family) n=1 Tax=Aminobacter carboxidus TaxID=376165 RepID=A0A8E1WEX0_9HYPH|nr:NUDIX hydrolase [Aminobacter lissarensis]MBB6467043.1 8-oxo-dGTP pyrophosphatase MutT (NUDIX family) [Aminobacter lissarensis]